MEIPPVALPVTEVTAVQVARDRPDRTQRVRPQPLLEGTVEPADRVEQVVLQFRGQVETAVPEDRAEPPVEAALALR